jgi:hypothetical protein
MINLSSNMRQTDSQKLTKIGNLLSAYSLVRIKPPISYIGFRPLQDAILREISIISRLLRLAPEDKRREIIPLSFQTAEKYFSEIFELQSSIENFPLQDDFLVEALKAIHHGVANFKRQFASFVFHGYPPPPLVLWAHCNFAARSLLRELEEDIQAVVPVSAKIERSIAFEPEFCQAGISILAYFGEVIRQKFPESDAKVRIEQQGLTVTLILETEAGEIERIERELTQYGLVVSGGLPVGEFMPRSIDAMRLQQKLEMAQMEIRHTRDLLNSERAGFGEQLHNLRNEIAFMRSLFDKERYEASHNADALRSLAHNDLGSSTQTLDEIAQLVSAGDEITQPELERKLSRLAEIDPDALNGVHRLLVDGAIQGAAKKFLYATLQGMRSKGGCA